MGIDWQKYPHTQAAHNHLDRFLATVRNTKVFWEAKRDGSNISIMYHKGFMLVYTRNQKAIESVELEVKRLLKPHLDNIKALLTANSLDGESIGIGILYGELVRKGKSPAQFEVNEEAEFVAFDLFDLGDNQFVDPSQKYELFEAFEIPHVPMEECCEFESVAGFLEHIDRMILDAKEKGLEGYVAKWMYNGEQHSIKAKVEHLFPHKREKKPRSTAPDTRPNLELSEVTGAIDKVYMEIGVKIFDKKVAMPLIAKAVGVEATAHGKKNRHGLFPVYLEFLKALKEA